MPSNTLVELLPIFTKEYVFVSAPERTSTRCLSTAVVEESNAQPKERLARVTEEVKAWRRYVFEYILLQLALLY